MNPLAIALQGLGFGAMHTALQGLIALIAPLVAAEQGAGGNPLKTRRRIRRTTQPPILNLVYHDDDELVSLALAAAIA